MRTRRSDERGAAAVEFALILPVLMLILFGIIEWSLMFKDSLTVASATRAGARTASAEPRTAAFADNTALAVARAVTALPSKSIQELWVYKARADGMPDSGSFSSCTTCVKFSWDSVGKKFTRKPGTDWDPATQNACAGTSDAVGVYLKVDHEFITGFIAPNRVLTDHTVMNLEPVPVFQGCK
jgi:Flp pilus assembly protein TadG